MKPPGAKLDWKPVEYADGIYWELKLTNGYARLFSCGNGVYEIRVRKGDEKMGTIEELEKLISE